jgi:putative tryptophan/tyrosine transport system substrate-binding protein
VAPARAAKAATTTIPVLFTTGDDPVRLGLVASLARPDGNLTGVSFLVTLLSAKRFEFLRALAPGAVRVAALVNPAETANTEITLRDLEAAARTLGLQIQAFRADTADEINAAFETIARERPDALFIAATPFFVARRVHLTQLAAFHRLPAAYPLRDFAEAGGLMSYGASIADAYHQVGVYTGRILKGAKPADLPVVQSTKLELVINRQTAAMLGLTIPDKLLAAADEVIE